MLERKKFISLVPKIDPIGYKILLEILAKGHFAKIRETPIVFHMREKGSSKLDLKTRAEFLKQMASLMLR
jgi:dolichol-phosphate mannosyltransferase